MASFSHKADTDKQGAVSTATRHRNRTPWWDPGPGRTDGIYRFRFSFWVLVFFSFYNLTLLLLNAHQEIYFASPFGDA